MTLINSSTDRTLLVLYGSETGYAQEVAERVAREGRRRLFSVRVLAMDDYDKVGTLSEVSYYLFAEH